MSVFISKGIMYEGFDVPSVFISRSVLDDSRGKAYLKITFAIISSRKLYKIWKEE